MNSSLTGAMPGNPSQSSNGSLPGKTKSTRVAFLTNFIPPYWKPVLGHLSAGDNNLRILVSTIMEADRNWKVDWEGLDVVLQRTLTVPRNVRNPLGFRELIYIHLPLDTLGQLRRFRADVVISAEMGFRTIMAIVYRWLHPATRLVVYADLSQRTAQACGWFRALLRKVITKNADGFVVLGESGARYIRGFGVAGEKIFRVPYATDVSRFQKDTAARDSDSAYRLLYVGRLVERKGILPFVITLSEWVKANPVRQAELVLIGSGPLRNELEKIDAPERLRLTFVGEKGYADMPDVYAQSGILVFPTLADTWGLVINEALAAGLPVLGSVYSQAVEELVQDGWNGWTFRTDHKDEMLRAIDRTLNTPIDELNRMRERARSRVLTLTSENMASQIQNVVECVSPGEP